MHLVGVSARLEGSHLHAEKVIGRMGIFRRHQENRVTPCLKNVYQMLGILLGAQGGFAAGLGAAWGGAIGGATSAGLATGGGGLAALPAAGTTKVSGGGLRGAWPAADSWGATDALSVGGLTVGGMTGGAVTTSVDGTEREARSLYPTRNPSEKKTPQVATHTRNMRIKYRAEWLLSSCSLTSVATMLLLAHDHSRQVPPVTTPPFGHPS